MESLKYREQQQRPLRIQNRAASMTSNETHHEREELRWRCVVKVRPVETVQSVLCLKFSVYLTSLV